MENSASLFLFILAGAFIFAYGCHYTSYLASRMAGRQLLFLVAYIAAALLLVSRLLLLFMQWLFPEEVLKLVTQGWTWLVEPFNVTGLPTFVAAFLLAPLLAILANRIYGADKASTRAIRRYAGERERLLYDAMRKERLVLITLASRKAYIGWPVHTPDLRHETEDFRLLPAISGYRDEQTLELHQTTQYVTVYESIRNGEIKNLQAKDFEIAVPLEQVVTAVLFSLDMSQDLFGMPHSDTGEEGNSRPSPQEKRSLKENEDHKKQSSRPWWRRIFGG